jgi:tRNA (guanine-N7-)-methyltransferase
LSELRNRPIRSFVVRTGRMTSGQTRALDELWPRYGVEYSPGMLNFAEVFGRPAPLTIEIGFGNGEHLASLAAAHPERNYFGIEVHRPGVGHLFMLAEKNLLSNVRASSHDAVEVLRDQVAPGVDEILVLFPDPWHKKRHHKRRLIQPPFVELIASRLRPGGVFRLATDWEHYALQMLEVIGANAALENMSATGDWMPRPDERAPTRFEKRGARLGHGVWDLAFRRCS